MDKAELLQAFSGLIASSHSMVALAGAGISTESGIPDLEALREYGKRKRSLSTLMTLSPVRAGGRQASGNASSRARTRMAKSGT